MQIVWLQATDVDELEKAVNTALEEGYRHIDTAPVYENEEVIGKVLKKWIDSRKIKRSELFIVTKVLLINIDSTFRIYIFTIPYFYIYSSITVGPSLIGCMNTFFCDYCHDETFL